MQYLKHNVFLPAVEKYEVFFRAAAGLMPARQRRLVCAAVICSEPIAAEAGAERQPHKKMLQFIQLHVEKLLDDLLVKTLFASTQLNTANVVAVIRN
jgi:hypothetical protein